MDERPNWLRSVFNISFNKANRFQLYTLLNIWIILFVLVFQVAILICFFLRATILVLESIMSYLKYLYPSRVLSLFLVTLIVSFNILLLNRIL